MHLFLLNLEKVCCVCVCDLETSGEFFSFCKVLLHRIFFSSITMEKLVLFSLSFSLDFLLVRKLWHVERRDANLSCRSQQACHGYSWLNGKEVRVHGGKKNKTY